jgi:isocitrate lyase
MGAAYGCAALALGVSMQSAFLGMAFYLVGWMCGQKVGPAAVTGPDAPSLQPSGTSVESSGPADSIA